MKRGTMRQRGEIDGCAFCLEPCSLGSGLDPCRKSRRGGSSTEGGIAWCGQCYSAVHSECWDRYCSEQTDTGIKTAAVESMSRDELRDALATWYPCPTCRTTGKMALWPKPRKPSVRQQIAELERWISEEASFLEQICTILAGDEPNDAERELLQRMRSTSVDALARQRSDLRKLEEQCEERRTRRGGRCRKPSDAEQCAPQEAHGAQQGAPLLCESC